MTTLSDQTLARKGSLSAVDQFTHRVEVPRMNGGLSDHVHHDRTQIRKVQTPARPDRVGLLRCRVKWRRSDDRVGPANLGPVTLEYLRGGRLRQPVQDAKHVPAPCFEMA